MRFWIKTQCAVLSPCGKQYPEARGCTKRLPIQLSIFVVSRIFYLVSVFWFFDFLTRVRWQSLWHFNCLFAQSPPVCPHLLCILRGPRSCIRILHPTQVLRLCFRKPNTFPSFFSGGWELFLFFILYSPLRNRNLPCPVVESPSQSPPLSRCRLAYIG